MLILAGLTVVSATNDPTAIVEEVSAEAIMARRCVRVRKKTIVKKVIGEIEIGVEEEKMHGRNLIEKKIKLMKKNVCTLFFMAALAIVALAACHTNTVYDHYNHTLIDGWDKNDTLIYHVPKIKEGGVYDEQLCLRINGTYPFMGLTLIVEQRVFPDGRMRVDTLNCKFSDRDGFKMAHGISHSQYCFPIARLQLNANDSLSINVRHDMKRDLMPGISDVGIKIVKP